MPRNMIMDLSSPADLAQTVHNRRVFDWRDGLVFVALSAAGLLAIAYFLSDWMRLPAWHSYPAMMVLLTILIAVVLFNNQGRWFLLPMMKRPEPMPIRSAWRVGVVTTFVGGAESLDMLEETVAALRAMEYPHETWVLDESDDPDVTALCRRLGAQHFSRKSLRHYHAERGVFQSHSKHGNYNAWLYDIGFERYDIISAFDPDHIPARTFLTEVLGYFHDPRIGYVQAAQAYYNQQASFIARGAAEETYAYYSSVQMASYGMGYPIVIGCHNTHRVAALKDVDGFAPHDADDLLITRRYRSRGWQGIYLPKILARGLTPVDWTGYLRQQRRWARSVLDLKLRGSQKISARLPAKSRAMSLLHGVNYIHKALLIPLGLLAAAIMLSTGTAQEALTARTVFRLVVLAMVLQVCEWYRQRFYLDRAHEWGWHWRAGLLHFAKWPHLLLALWDVMMDRRLPYTLTPKVKVTSKPVTMMRPQMIVAGTISGAWAIGVVTQTLVNPALHVCAGGIVLTSLILIATERWTYPAPYLRPSAEGDAVAPSIRRPSSTDLH